MELDLIMNLTFLKDLNRVEDQVIVTIVDMEMWTTRIFEAIDSGVARSVWKKKQ